MNRLNCILLRWAASLAVVCLPALSAAPAPAEPKPAEPKVTKDKFSYCIGVNMASNLRREKVEVNLDEVMKGLKDTLAGNPTVNDQEAVTAIRAFLNERRKEVAEENKAAGQKYLAENKTKPGVIALPDGLQYKVLAEGSGQSPKSNDLVTVNYRGTLLNGTEFDSSAKRGKPATFAANRVVKGWSEALQLMKPGAKWELTIPPELAYGEFGKPPDIGRNETLRFEIELLSFEPPPPVTNAPAAPATSSPGIRLTTNAPVTSDIIKVPSKEEMDKGAKIEVIKKEDLERIQKEEQEKAAQKK